MKEKRRISKTTSFIYNDTCNDGMQCVLDESTRGTQELDRDVCKHCTPPGTYTPQKCFKRAIKMATFFNGEA